MGEAEDQVDKFSAPVYLVYPLNAASVTVSGTTTAWAWGSWTEIIPVNTVTKTFWIIGLAITNTSQAVPTIIQIGKGASGSEAAIANFKIRGVVSAWMTLPSPIRVEANTRIAARVAQAGTSFQATDISVAYLTDL